MVFLKFIKNYCQTNCFKQNIKIFLETKLIFKNVIFLESKESNNKSNWKKFKNDFIFKCYECKKNFDCSNDYYEHENQKHSRVLCEFCNFLIDSDIYNFHIDKCELIFNHYSTQNRTKNCLNRTITDKSMNQIGSGEKSILFGLKNTPFILSRKAFKNFLTQYEMKNYKIHSDVLKLFIDYRSDISNFIKFD